MQENDQKKMICKALGDVLQELRGEQSQFMFSSENDISVSIINTIERGLKDPQLTTIFKISEALGMKSSDFVKLVENKLPKDFTMLDL